MMRLEELAPRAGQEIRDATRGLQPPGIMEVRSSRRRRNGMSAALTAFIGTLAVVGIAVLWPTGGDGGPVSPPQQTTALPQSTTTIETVTPVEPSIRGYRLLDGRTATVETHAALTLKSYSFFIDTPDLDPPGVGGGRHVTVALGDPSDMAVTQNAAEEATLSDTTTLWRADREGQPLFLSIDLGAWVVWLNVENQANRPSDDALLQVAQQLTGTADERGVVLDGLALQYHELHLVGPEDVLVTLRIGTCFNESVPASETVEDPRWGQVIRSEQRAAWCIGDGDFEVEVYGSEAFVDSVVAGIDVSISETTPATDSTGGQRRVELPDSNMALTYPEDWHLAKTSLTPNLGSPTEVFSIGSFPLIPGGPNCAQIPSQALHDMTATDVFVTVQERGGADPSGFEPRPDSFGPVPGSTDNVIGLCLESDERDDVRAIHWIWFSDQDRYFHVLVAIGRDASPEDTAAVWEVLNEMDIRP